MILRLNNGGADLYFKGMWLLTIGMYILIPIGSSLLGMLYAGIHVLTILVFILVVLHSLYQGKIDVFNGKRMLIVIGMVTVIFLSTRASEETLTTDPHIINILNFLEMLFAIYIMDKVTHDESAETFVFWVNIVIALTFCALSLTSYAYSNIRADSLSLGYSNPNATAIYLLMNISLLLLYSVKVKNVWRKLPVYLLSAYLLYLLYKTNSRTCLAAAIVVVAYIIVAPKWKIPSFFVPVFMLIPLGFLLFYTSMYQTEKFTDLTILGKPFFSGREVFYIRRLEELKQSILVGDVGLAPFRNLHNGPLALMASCGILGYALYLQYIGNTIRHYYRNNVSHQQTVALIVILATFIHSCAEAALVVGGANYAIVVATFYWMLKGDGTFNGGQPNNQ